MTQAFLVISRLADEIKSYMFAILTDKRRTNPEKLSFNHFQKEINCIRSSKHVWIRLNRTNRCIERLCKPQIPYNVFEYNVFKHASALSSVKCNWVALAVKCMYWSLLMYFENFASYSVLITSARATLMHYNTAVI